MLFKICSIVEVIYLVIRFKKTMSFLWNQKNTDRNGVNEQYKHTTHIEKNNFREGYLVLISDAPFFRTTSLPTPP